jgi:hypothetical protein
MFIKDAAARITGELIEKPEYKYVDPRIVADVVLDTLNRNRDLELEEGN